MATKKFPLFNTVKYLLFLGLGILLLYLAFRGRDINQLIADLADANYYWVGLSLVFGVTAYVSRAKRWLILLEPMGYHPKLSNSLYAVVVGYFANIAVPRIGELTRCTALNQVEKIPVDKLFGTVILERVIDMFMLLSLTLLTILLQIDVFGNFFFNLFTAKSEGEGGIGSILPYIGIGMLMMLLLVFLLRKRLRKFAFVQKAKTFVMGIKDGFVTVLKLKKKRWFIFHTLLIWILYYLMTYVCFFSIDATSHLTPVDGLFVLATGGFGMAAPVQGGIGAYHYVVSLGLGVLSVPYSEALLFATIVHTSQTLMTLVLGSISMLMLYIARRKAKRKLNEVSSSTA